MVRTDGAPTEDRGEALRALGPRSPEILTTA